MTRRKAKGHWVTMGPAPYFATCERCGKHIDPPPMPLPVEAFVKYGEYAVALHMRCEKPDTSALSGDRDATPQE